MQPACISRSPVGTCIRLTGYCPQNQRFLPRFRGNGDSKSYAPIVVDSSRMHSSGRCTRHATSEGPVPIRGWSTTRSISFGSFKTKRLDIVEVRCTLPSISKSCQHVHTVLSFLGFRCLDHCVGGPRRLMRTYLCARCFWTNTCGRLRCQATGAIPVFCRSDLLPRE